jgi:hypothetical protein
MAVRASLRIGRVGENHRHDVALLDFAGRHPPAFCAARKRDQLQGALVSAMHSDLGLHAAQLAIGFGCSVLGGLIAASIAKQHKRLNGALASWLCVGIGVYALAQGKGGEPLPLHLALIALTPVCYVLGALLRIKMKRGAGAIT